MQVQRIVVAANYAGDVALLAALCKAARWPMARENATNVGNHMRAGDVWLCPVGERPEIPDPYQGKVLAFCTVEVALDHLRPLAVARLDDLYTHCQQRQHITWLDPFTVPCTDDGTCGTEPKQYDGLVQALLNDEVAVAMVGDLANPDGGWLWFNRTTGKCTTRHCTSVPPAQLARLTTLPPR